jgi:hypothetical protein
VVVARAKDAGLRWAEVKVKGAGLRWAEVKGKGVWSPWVEAKAADEALVAVKVKGKAAVGALGQVPGRVTLPTRMTTPMTTPIPMTTTDQRVRRGAHAMDTWTSPPLKDDRCQHCSSPLTARSVARASARPEDRSV